MKITAFAASSSSRSINKKLVTYAVSLIEGAKVEILDLNDYELPLYSEDKEKELGHPELAQHFLEKIAACDALLISFAEHNGSYTAAYKNLFDWCSRINAKVFSGKSMVIMATSPGSRGGQTVLTTAQNAIPHFGGHVVGSFSLPSFYDNFDLEKEQIKEDSLRSDLLKEVKKLMA